MAGSSVIGIDRLQALVECPNRLEDHTFAPVASTSRLRRCTQSVRNSCSSVLAKIECSTPSTSRKMILSCLKSPDFAVSASACLESDALCKITQFAVKVSESVSPCCIQFDACTGTTRIERKGGSMWPGASYRGWDAKTRYSLGC